jgi:hypothetical protein
MPPRDGVLHAVLDFREPPSSLLIPPGSLLDRRSDQSELRHELLLRRIHAGHTPMKEIQA